MAAYIALLRKDENGFYVVNFPDFPKCTTASRSLGQASRMATDTLKFHIEGMHGAKMAIPASLKTLDDVMSNPDHRDAVAFMVDVPVSPPLTVRITLTMPTDVLDAVDGSTTNRSRFFAQAARDRLAHLGSAVPVSRCHMNMAISSGSETL